MNYKPLTFLSMRLPGWRIGKACGMAPVGRRYDLAALTERKLGPVSLQERIVSLGGGLTIDSTEFGSRLEITLPLKHDWSPWDAQASDSAAGRNAM
jgi:hypothetical protein